MKLAGDCAIFSAVIGVALILCRLVEPAAQWLDSILI